MSTQLCRFAIEHLFQSHSSNAASFLFHTEANISLLTRPTSKVLELVKRQYAAYTTGVDALGRNHAPHEAAGKTRPSLYGHNVRAIRRETPGVEKRVISQVRSWSHATSLARLDFALQAFRQVRTSSRSYLCQELRSSDAECVLPIRAENTIVKFSLASSRFRRSVLSCREDVTQKHAAEL